ncbi:hypothetical protein GCM10027345_13720 [Hymenobacter daeguensis]
MLLGGLGAQAQTIGYNFNHNAEILDLAYLKKTKASWIRATPRIIDYTDGTLHVAGDPANARLIAAGKAGYKLLLGFRWDFHSHKMRVPTAGSAEETKLFAAERELLQQLGPYVTMFALGNEPNLETLDEDMVPDAAGKIPLVEFTRRQLEQVVEPYFRQRKGQAMPPIYLGSLPALFEKKQQEIPANNALLHWAQDDKRIAGFDLHLHIKDFQQAEDALKYARAIMPGKPIIVTEYSLHRLYLAHRTDALGDTPAGVAFAKKYGRDPASKLYEWCSIANSQGVSPEEWAALFASRPWNLAHHLMQFDALYRKYNVTLSTYPLFQQSCPENMKPDSPMWFINPIFLQKSLKKQLNGEISANPLSFDDFRTIANRGK